MADRYQDRPFPVDDDDDRGGEQPSARGDSDPLAELARLIGQTDPFAMGRANQAVSPRGSARDTYQPPAETDGAEIDGAETDDDGVASGPPPWMQRAIRHEAPQQDYPSAVHPLHRHAIPPIAPEP